MKSIRIKNLTLLALSSLGLLAGAAQAAPLSSDGEVLIGFRATGGTGSSVNYVVDLGQVAGLTGLTSVTTLPMTGVAADLTTAYGASWHTRTDLFWGAVAGVGNFAAVGSDAAKTVYATKPEATNGTLVDAWLRKGDSAQTSLGSRITAARGRYNISTAATNAATDTAVTMSTSDLNSWSSYQPSGSNSSGIGFAHFNPQIDGNPGKYLDLFRMPLGADEPGTLVGRMVLNSNASITFIPAAQVGVNVVQFGAATYSAAENAGTLAVTVTRTGDTSVAASVTISTSNGTGTAGTDYTALTNQAVNFAVGEASKNVLITIVNNPATQPDRTINVALGGASGGTTLGAQATAVATITDTVLPSVVSLQADVFTASPLATTVPVTLTRTGGTAAFTVTLTTTNDTAIAGTHYTAPATTVTFPANQTTTTVNITLASRTAAAPHRVFNIALSAPSGSNTLGALTSGIVRILSPDDNKPTVTIGATTPAALVNENLSDTVTIAGAATDDKAVIGRVEVQLNGGAVANATLNSTASGASYSLSVTPVGGLNTVKVQAFDAGGNASLIVTKTFTYVVKRAVAVVLNPGTTAGSVTGARTGAVYEVGKPLTLNALAKTGFIFNSWTITGLTGIPTEVAALNVTLTDALARTFTSDPLSTITVTANFITNPFTADVIGEFNGLVIADGSSTPSNATNGLISTFKVTGTGTFTGTLRIDGFTLPLTGLFDNTGVAKFGAARTTTLFVARPDKPSYELALTIDLAASGNTNRVTGTLKQRYRRALVSNSIVTLDRAAFSATNQVPSNYLVNKGLYNVVFPARASQVDLTSADYPQGDGVGSITVDKLGKASLAATLADGTVVTASALLSKDLKVPLFAQLYGAPTEGSLGGVVTLDDTEDDSDVSGTNFFWFRPWQDVHHYPWGWPEGIAVDLVGTKFAVPVGASVLPDLLTGPPNATLVFSDGLLDPSPVSKDVQISATNVVTKYAVFPALDTSYTLTITAATGKIAGDFTHTDGTKPKFNGVILQKGANREAFGYFLTVAPKVITGLGESGAVSLSRKAPSL